MFKSTGRKLMVAILGLGILGCSGRVAEAVTLPDPVLDAPLAQTKSAETIVVSGGCFWGVQAVFQHVKGVTQAVSGYAGGQANTATYDVVSTGTTGHAESVQVTYDPSQVTVGQILKVFFSVAHDPTQVDAQGPDHGTQYRSAIFFTTPSQQKIVDAYIDQLQKAKVFAQPIATKVEPLNGFYAAEAYHQNYALMHPHNPYIMINDAPKVVALEKQFPNLYVKQP